jgi:hypothetical protein
MPYAAFRRQPMPQQYEQALQTSTFPAPTRGIIENENEAYMQPGGAVVQDNWVSTLRGVKVRGGHVRWNDLHALDTPVPPVPDLAGSRLPVESMFEYVSGNVNEMFAANETKLFEVTGADVPILIKSGQTSGNYSTAQLANAADDWLIAVNDAGDYPLRYNGTAWEVLDPALSPTNPITGPAGTPVVNGHGLTYVWKYRNRLFFIQGGTMDAWYLNVDSVGGALQKIPLSGAASRGGSLLFGASWSIDAGDGIDDKNVFVTTLGEVLIFTGSNPSDPANWRQEGRYMLSPPLGMNAHVSVGGDLLILTVAGVIPLSQAISKTGGQLDLAMLTRTVRRLWRETVAEKQPMPWTAKQWDEYGAIFIATPGGDPGNRWCFVANNVTAAWARFSWDATCWGRIREAMFFGTQDGLVMQANRSGYDDGKPFVCTLVGSWEMFGAPSAQIVWHQARASFRSRAGQPFKPQLSAAIDYVITIPTPPPVGPDPGIADVWDQGKWGPAGSGDLDPPPPADIEAYAQWDQPSLGVAPVRNTLWVSVGKTGHSHAPVVQVSIGQEALPEVELIAISTTFERAGVNV